MADYAVEPWGEDRIEQMIARLCAMYAATHGVKDARPDDFLYRFVMEDKPRVQSDEEQRAIVEAMQAKFEALSQ